MIRSRPDRILHPCEGLDRHGEALADEGTRGARAPRRLLREGGHGVDLGVRRGRAPAVREHVLLPGVEVRHDLEVLTVDDVEVLRLDFLGQRHAVILREVAVRHDGRAALRRECESSEQQEAQHLKVGTDTVAREPVLLFLSFSGRNIQKHVHIHAAFPTFLPSFFDSRQILKPAC